jgi:alpha-tubulin suppressor-like RCC1 family protein
MSEHLSCAVTVEGRVQCWDANGGNLDVSQVTEGTGIAVTTQDVVVQRADGSSRCFSLRDHGSSGGGITPPRWAPVACGPSRVVELGTISYDTCERREDGVIACRKVYEAPPAAKPIPGGPYAAFASGPRHACAVQRDGSLRCWGANGFGQSTPPSGAFRAVAPGGSHTCAIRDDGRLLCWGGYAGTPL